MNLTIPQPALAAALAAAGRAIPAKPYNDILKHARVTIAPSGIVITGSDQTLTIHATVDAQSPDAEAFTVPHHRLKEVIDLLPPEAECVLAIEEREIPVSLPHPLPEGTAPPMVAYPYLTLTTGATRCSWQCRPGEQYPADQPAWEPAARITLGAALVRQCLGAVATTMEDGDDTDRPILEGTLWESDGATLVMVAMDGRGLACYELPVTTDETPPFRFVMSRRTVTTLLAMLPGSGDVTFAFDERNRHCRIEMTGVTIHTDAIAGTYPEWRRFLEDTAAAAEVIIDRAELLRAIRSLSAVDSHQLRMTYRDQALSLSMKDDDAKKPNQATATLDPTPDSSGAGRIAVDPRLLANLLRKLPSAAVTLRWHDLGTKPIHIIADEIPGYRAILMPLLVTEAIWQS